MTQVHFHDVAAITLGPLVSYPQAAPHDKSFWTLEITLTDHQGNQHRIVAFAQAKEALALAPYAPPSRSTPLTRVPTLSPAQELAKAA